ncbi:DUF2437 domain-containing protein [Sphingomonas histidinilytica]|uniref:2-keto-4-pentenoate hydratase/2-oxohepta-3-ene-1,7-dioic acid hydratase (Catechol pathway) n=1 Tax=Rhizorhabdus histidinilytica TaxID=439228 RepID=A0A1T5FM08_9SPHN|nr:fumarylacetoacetate hydrolase family protein [Rhizorhabdus histidinilytica]MBO9380097.1 DUF2437 domain-containing protein [Rhizorhabdus histidinilytica]SKB97136.1 2-keto-4-pentenoate hydratase/2-oxohepta-3-ene-1,7-dioic acid hydratase (catechol pathway) [Rhizorhabdus histidinilytica]
MRIARFRIADGRILHGLVEGDVVKLLADPPAGGIETWLQAGAFDEAISRTEGEIPLSAIRLLAPIAEPPKFLGLGGNYRSHLDEIAHLGIAEPTTQIWFNKQRTCVAGPFDEVVIPRLSKAVDYEVELAVVIGRRCRNVPASHAHDVIAGYMVCNDVSARDIQMRAQTMTLGKSFDTHGPIGPWLVTADEIADCQSLRLRTWVNGELRQDGNTSEMKYTVAQQIEELSAVFTLEPGDILATGTPAGVGAAFQPPKFLRHGDVVRLEIDQIGVIENIFVDGT